MDGVIEEMLMLGELFFHHKMMNLRRIHGGQRDLTVQVGRTLLVRM
ncbi:hypothetical protein [Xenorhabdus vietnamensis]|nr:hypothetical protein [Xenorhabdus vietnamensis]